MAFTLFQFTRRWTNASDFPAYEDSEARVRADMQALPDELMEALNTHIGEETASNVRFARTAGVPADTVQAAVENVQGQLAGISQQGIADASVTEDKLADGAVTAAKLAASAVGFSAMGEGAVGTAALREGAVTASALADGAVTEGALAALCVSTGKLGNYSVTALKLAENSVDATKLCPGAVSAAALAEGCVGTSALAANSVTGDYTAEVEGETVTVQGKLADGAVHARNLAEGCVSFDKTDGESIQRRRRCVSVTVDFDGETTAAAAVTGLTADSAVIVSPAPASFVLWTENAVRCSGQAAGVLSFTCETAPDVAVTANVLILD